MSPRLFLKCHLKKKNQTEAKIKDVPEKPRTHDTRSGSVWKTFNFCLMRVGVRLDRVSLSGRLLTSQAARLMLYCGVTEEVVGSKKSP
jgi:hypothetical protein